MDAPDWRTDELSDESRGSHCGAKMRHSLEARAMLRLPRAFPKEFARISPVRWVAQVICNSPGAIIRENMGEWRSKLSKNIYQVSAFLLL